MQTIQLNVNELNSNTVNYNGDADCYEIATPHGQLTLPIIGSKTNVPAGLAPIIPAMFLNGEPVHVALLNLPSDMAEEINAKLKTVGEIIASYRFVETGSRA